MNVKLYKCFIGSPSDTLQERNYCKDVIDQINNTIGESLQFRIEPLMWENVTPSFGEDGQDVINQELLVKEYNLFIGIMWAKFGSHTHRSESGTIEEFEDAYQRYKDKKDVQILMYFNKKDIPQSAMDLDQIAKVFEFKKRVSELGGLYNEYIGADQFKENLRVHLSKYFLEKHKNTKTASLISNQTIETDEIITNNLKNKLIESLTMFNGTNPCWVDPVLSNTNNISSNYVENYNAKVNLDSIILSPKSIIIKSPPQFGLTTLAHYLITKGWENRNIWLYINASELNRNDVSKTVLNELKRVFFTQDPSKIKCIILDSWKSSITGSMKMLRNLSLQFPNTPIIVMHTIDANDFLLEPQTENIEREFEVMHLLSLPKTEIRKMVTSYNRVNFIADDDRVLNKIVLDLDTLNIHRTPLNCLTLLKVSEKYFDEKTVNRTDMLHKVLFILFDFNNIPTYQSRPDLKDCEFVLGCFCENMLRIEKYHFTKSEFITYSQQICADNFIDLDLNILFDIMFSNGIIISRLNEFSFRASYWIFYFAAHRMHGSTDFANFIFESGKYSNYPEVVEFYTGIDRRRTDALEILNKDLIITYNEVLNKIGLPEHIDPYIKVEWNPSSESIEKARQEIGINIQSSKLPIEIKDQHSDSKQNQLKPYDQGIKKMMQEYSLSILMLKISACSRALRNSDYANADAKKALLESILSGYEQVAKSLMILTPELAINGEAAFAGHAFYLQDNFGSTIMERLNQILQSIPSNVIKFFKDDINSEKIGPLLINKINSEKFALNKYMLIVLLANVRCTAWRKTIEQYINGIPKNSFYLFDLMGILRALYEYEYLSETEENEVRQLLLLGYSKHEFPGGKPSKLVYNRFTQDILKRPKIDGE
jgi:hypothetical protein